MISIWEKTSNFPEFSSLHEDIRTEVLIIGGGMTGLLCAYMLHQAGVPYVLVEARTLCNGITKNTTAKITYQHGLIYDNLIKRFGLERARQYFDANKEALETYSSICSNIDCDFELKDSYVYSIDGYEKLEKELRAFEKLGVGAEFCASPNLPFDVAGAIKLHDQAQFHPLKFAAAICHGLRIYEHTPILELKDFTAITDHGRITAQKIIVATHFPFLNKHGSYFLKLYQHRSYVIALENAPDLGGMYVDEAQNGMSFRNYKNMLFIGGGDHRTGKKGGAWKELREFKQKYYPETDEKYFWATQDCMTLDGIPYIGQYSASTKNLYVATGFNKWGMTSSMAAAMLLSDMVQERHNPYQLVFSPSRSILRPQLAVNAFEAVAGLLTPASRRCPHLGCALKWNKYEHTWDCSCHGSRFTQDGKLIDNPATGDLKM